MSKKIVIKNNIERADYAFISAILLNRHGLGAASKYLSFSVLVIWLLSAPEHNSIFIKIILFTSFPWLLFVFRLAINFYSQDKLTYSTMVFKTDCFLMNTERNETRLDYEVSRNTIKQVLFLKKYIVIFSTASMFVIICKSLDKDKKVLITDYLNASLEQLKDTTDSNNVKRHLNGA